MKQHRLSHPWYATTQTFLLLTMEGDILVLLSTYHIFSVMLGNRNRKVTKT